ncbi:Protein N-acetyltransferase, RimJ/RimL family [Marvinbryantia formatexigens]|nr:Protein N-acetyltransferase, RimJ/RimL family [Marvinbryantia formatexigens]
MLPFPVTQESFHNFLKKLSMKQTCCAYVATEDTGQPVGFFCYSVDTENNTGFLKFIIVDKEKRQKGYGKEMLNLALQYAFHITGAGLVQLNVFAKNAAAKRCYEKIGFVENHFEKNVFEFKDELWSRYNLVISK